jgi:hypothetical protein
LFHAAAPALAAAARAAASGAAGVGLFEHAVCAGQNLRPGLFRRLFFFNTILQSCDIFGGEEKIRVSVA